MRKTLPLIERRFFELFSNFKYELPKDPELMLYDFYFMTAFGNEIDGVNMNANYAIDEASDDVVDALHIHMKKAVFFALCAEIRHLFDMYNLEKIEAQISKRQFEFLQEYYKQMILLNNMRSNISKVLNIDTISEMDPRDRSILTVETSENRMTSHKAVKLTMKKFNWDRSRFAVFCDDAFNAKGWSASYGGKPWAAIGHALYKLENASKKSEKMIWIDHAYDLQHNTDTVFNKLKLYYKNNGYQWIAKALDWKRDVLDYKDYYKKVSPQLKPLVGYISKTKTGRSVLSADDEVVTPSNAPGEPQTLPDFGTSSSPSKFKIGDKVKVKYPGMAFTDAPAWASNAGLTNYELYTSPKENVSYMIVWIGLQPAESNTVAGIEDQNGLQYLIKEKGLIKSSGSSSNSNGLQHVSGAKVKSGDTVTISNIDYAIITPGIIKEWGIENGFSFGSNVFAQLDNGDQCKVVEVGTHSLFNEPIGQVVAVIQPKGSNKVYAIDILGLKKKSLPSISPSSEIRTAPGVHKFNPGDTVKISSVEKLIELDDNIEQWGLNNGIVLYDPDDGIGFMQDFEVVYTGENDYLPGKTIVLIKQAHGVHGGKTFLINQTGLKLKEPEPTLNFKFEVGDKVKVTNPGKGFSQYNEWAAENNFSLDSGITPETGHVYTIIAAAPHFSQPLKLYGIEDQGGMKFIMGEAGLEKISGSYQSPVSDSTTVFYEFGIGDQVDVTDPSFAFTEYTEWASEHGFSLDSGDYPSKDFIYTIFAMGPHELHPGLALYAIKDQNDIRFIMDGKGLKLNLTGENPSDTIGPPMQANEIEDDFIDISAFSNKWSNVYLEKSAKRFIEAHFKKFKWVTDAYISNAKISLDKNDKLVFLEGTWEDGTWLHGTWLDGTWLDGTWRTGTWVDGTWVDGTWNNGVWKTGTWHGGIWRKGFWRKGTWNGGNWKNGTWNNGTWNNGLWESGIWKKGLWEKGVWKDGIWEKGVWNAGNWNGGVWNDGTWNSGIWNDGTWNGGEFNGGDWNTGEFNDGTWNDGTWNDGAWNGGTWIEGKLWDEEKEKEIKSTEAPS